MRKQRATTQNDGGHGVPVQPFEGQIGLGLGVGEAPGVQCHFGVPHAKRGEVAAAEGDLRQMQLRHDVALLRESKPDQ